LVVFFFHPGGKNPGGKGVFVKNPGFQTNNPSLEGRKKRKTKNEEL